MRFFRENRVKESSAFPMLKQEGKPGALWRQAVDPNSGRTYYYEIHSKQSTWEKVRISAWNCLIYFHSTCLGDLFVISTHICSPNNRYEHCIAGGSHTGSWATRTKEETRGLLKFLRGNGEKCAYQNEWIQYPGATPGATSYRWWAGFGSLLPNIISISAKCLRW